MKSITAICVAAIVSAFIAVPAHPQDFGADVLRPFPFNHDRPGTNTLLLAPREFDSIYFAGDTVTISNSLDHDIFVYTYDRNGKFKLYKTSRPPVTFSPPVGYYLAASIGDRASFVVFPHDYRGSRKIGAETATAQSRLRRVKRAQIGTLRNHADAFWKNVQPASGTPPNYAKLKSWIDAMPTDNRLVITASFAPTWATNDLVNGFSAYINGLCSFLTNYPSREIVIQVDNEPTFVPQGAIPWIHTGKRWQDALGEAMTASLPPCKTIAPHLQFAIGNFDDYNNAWAWGNFAEFQTNGYYNLGDFVSFYPTGSTIFPQDTNSPSGPHTNYTALAEINNLRSVGITNRVQVGEAYVRGQSVLGESMPTSGSCGTTATWYQAANRIVWNQLLYAAAHIDLFVGHTFAENYGGDDDLNKVNCASHGFAPSLGAPSRGIRAPAAWWLQINHLINNKTVYHLEPIGQTHRIVAIDQATVLLFIKRTEGASPIKLTIPNRVVAKTLWDSIPSKTWVQLTDEPLVMETTIENALELFAINFDESTE